MSSQLPARKTPAAARRWRRRAVASACALALALPAGWVPVAAQNALPALGDTDSADFTVGNERKLGDDIMRQVRTDPDYVDDPLLLEYLQSVWQPLLKASRSLGNITPDLDQRFAWEPFLVRDASVNAFAWPGGYVGVHLGLIAITTTSDELASVLAHEMSHVSQRHIARSITGDSKRSLVGLAALLLGMLAASRSHSPDAANAVIAGTQAATAQGQLNFSRDVEREADRVGYQVMTAAGYAPGGMAAMFERMDRATRLNDYGGYPYLRSHPLTVERIGEARARASAREPQTTACTVGSDGVCRMPGSTIAGDGSAGQKIVGSGVPALPSVLEHTVAQARASVLMDPRTDALRRWQARDADRGGSAADKLRA
nr:M48 family metalloprotease [Caldimonas sp.]